MVEYSERYYTELFVGNGEWAGLYPNLDETMRLGAILAFLGVARRAMPTKTTVRILDVGCGRGWLTTIVRPFGEVEGVEPVRAVVEEARRRYPDLRFHHGTANTLLEEGLGRAFDIIICTEVIEHVPTLEQGEFVSDIARLLRPGGYALVTTPRGRYKRRAARVGYAVQPVEDWLSERDLERLFRTQGLVPVQQRRIHVPLPRLSWSHRLAASTRVERLSDRLYSRWLLEGMRCRLGFYQAWLFESNPGA